MRLLLILSFVFVTKLVAGFSYDDSIQEDWKAFKLTYKKQYENEIEEQLRQKTYIENAYEIAKHNQKYELGLVTYKLKINEFSDMFDHELDEMVNGFNRKSLLNQLKGTKRTGAATFIPPANAKYPERIDWREYGAVTPVKRQGHCGSCWSFSATGSIEGQVFRKYGKLVSLSAQNLIDCAGKKGKNGCKGGSVYEAFDYVRDNHGIDTEASYPYEFKYGKCRYNPANSGANITEYVDIESGNEKALLAAVATVGPISVAIDAKDKNFVRFSEGIYFNPDCSSKHLHHEVLVVGYGTENGNDYWLVKNSWGSHFGDQGYIKMARNKNNHCGIATSATYPLV